MKAAIAIGVDFFAIPGPSAAGTSLALNFLLVPHYGKDGSGAAWMAAGLCGVTYLFAESQRNYRIPYRFGQALACLAFSWALILVDKFLVPPGGALALVAHCLMLLLFVPIGILLRVVRIRDLRGK